MMRVAVAAAIALLLGACALGLRDITLSEAELQALIERHIAKPQRVAEVIELTLERPQIRLLPERNRIASALDITVLERISGRTLRGSLSAEHTLRYEPADTTLRIAQLRVQDFKLDLGAGALTGRAARLAAGAAPRPPPDAVVWRASESQRERLTRAGVQRADIQVTPRGVEVRFSSP
jgi:hypothetical protein